MVKQDRTAAKKNAGTQGQSAGWTASKMLQVFLAMLVLTLLVGLQLFQSSIVTGQGHELGAVEDLSRVLQEMEKLKQELKVAKQQPQQQQPGKTPPKIDSCQAIVQRMLDWNHCWWRHVATMRHQELENVAVQDGSLSCPVAMHTHAANNGAEARFFVEEIGAPVMNLAWYHGQGFGRVVEHTMENCILAFLLKRPCLINFNSRDPNYTWRSFIQENTYRWDSEPLYDEFPVLAQQIDALVQKIKSQEFSNDWQGALNLADYDQPNSLVFPMEQKIPKDNYQQGFDYYHGNHPTRRRQILLSPSWGDAWFLKFPVDLILERDYQCKKSNLNTLLQNALFRPTAMAWQLHKPRYNQALQTAWAPYMKEKRPNATPRPLIPDKVPSILSHHPDIMNVPYGTIHIRLYFINARLESQKKPPITVPEMAEHVLACMDVARAMANEFPTPGAPPDEGFPVNWWFLGDNVPMTVQTAQEIINRQTENRWQSSGRTLPRLNIFHDYNPNEEKPSKESKNEGAMALYGHPVLGGSVQDWMALQQSDLSIVMADGSFGKSGSRGKGKVSTRLCGKEGDAQYLQVYRKVKSEDQRRQMCDGKGCM